MTIQYGLFYFILIIDQMYDLTFGQNGHLNLKTNQKNYVFFMPHSFNQNRHPFDQCRHFNQVTF
jgi:hypothetical protein